MTRRSDHPEGTFTDWREVVDSLVSLDRESLTAVELETLSDALFWVDALDESIEARAAAYRAFLKIGDSDGAAMAARRLFYEHWLVGETVVGRSWLERAKAHVDDRGSPRPRGSTSPPPTSPWRRARWMMRSSRRPGHLRSQSS